MRKHTKRKSAVRGKASVRGAKGKIAGRSAKKVVKKTVLKKKVEKLRAARRVAEKIERKKVGKKVVRKIEKKKVVVGKEVEKIKDVARVDEFASEQAELNIGMVGHVDHGKTSLTKQLTGVWTDTHSEELKRGISIRLGYADAVFYKCPKCEGAEAYSVTGRCPICGGKASKTRKVSFVDAPGHETLMTTMLSGAALMQGAILVIAANEPCPQARTEEHLMALKISGVSEIVVAQNKIDLVEREKVLENYRQIVGFLKKYGYENVPIIPTSANFGTNIDLLIEAVEKTIKTPKFDSAKPLKMYCARSFDINKPGAKPKDLKGGILGGSIIQGTVSIGDEIEVRPGIEEKKILAKVVSLSTALGKLQKAKPGGLIATGTLLDPTLTQNDRMRGQLIGKPGSLAMPTKNLKLEVHFLERLITDFPKEIKVNETVVVTVGTMTAVGTVIKSSAKEVEIALKNAVVIEKEQKIAISKKDASRWRLVAYGISR